MPQDPAVIRAAPDAPESERFFWQNDGGSERQFKLTVSPYTMAFPRTKIKQKERWEQTF